MHKQLQSGLFCLAYTKLRPIPRGMYAEETLCFFSTWQCLPRKRTRKYTWLLEIFDALMQRPELFNPVYWTRLHLVSGDQPLPLHLSHSAIPTHLKTLRALVNIRIIHISRRLSLAHQVS